MTARTLLMTLLIALPALSPAARAADRSKRPSAAKPARSRAPAKSASEPRAIDPPASSDDASSLSSAPRPSTNGTARTPKPRVYTFGGLDVDGKLKTPQLLFFRGRVKQELDTSSPEKRSFMKELQSSAEDKGL